MATDVAFSKYSSVARYVTAKPGWVPPAHQDRVAAYQVYQEIYWSHVSTSYKVMNRGLDDEDQPVYVPSSRIMVDTLDRYVGPKLTFQVDITTGSESTQLTAKDVFTKLFARERFASRYNAAKQSGLIRGDWGWHLIADPTKPEGSRISMLPFDPAHYYPIFEDETVQGGDPDKMVMVKLAEPVQVGDETQVRVQTYERLVDAAGAASIVSSLTMWKPEDWFLWRYDDEEAEPVVVLIPPTPLPPQITAFPVYHIPHRPGVNEIWGSSPMRGLEVLQAGLNQSVTDEDLALALMGLGVYATEEPGSPTDASGQPTSWDVYPGIVIQNAKGLHKVEGITGLQAYTDHIGRLEGYVGDASGATDAARGRLEVAEAESGIALQLRLAPTLALAEVQDQIILDVHRQMFYDLVQMWLPAYEGVNVTDVTVLPVLGDKLPVNRAAEVTMVTELVVANVLSAGSARTYLAKKGFVDMFDPREGDLVLAEMSARAIAEGGDSSLEDREAQERAGQNPPDGGLDGGEQP